MAYIGYSEHIPLFTKLLVDEFGSDYEGDSYLIYFENIRSYLYGDISSNDLLEFFDNSNFCIFELDHLIKNINDIIEKNISYKQKLNKFLFENINSEASDNRGISIKSLSLMFDDFMDIYNENIFDYESFYISIFGVFINLSQEKFMEFIYDIIKYNSLTFDDFYFLINFLKDMVEFKYLDKYVKEFILYSEDYLDVIDNSVEHISILMFLTFKLNKTLINLSKNSENDFWSKDKKFILATLKLFSNYCREYNLVFIEQIDDKNKKFIENRDVIYTFLKYLTEFLINEEDCSVILSVYSRLMFDYMDYDVVKKVTKIVKYLVSPVFKYDKIESIMVSNNTQDIINILSFSFLTGLNYVILFSDNCKKYGFNKEICLYILKLILSEEIDNKRDYFIYFIKIFYTNILEEFTYGDEVLFNYLLWITNDIVNSGTNITGIEDVINLLSRNNKIQNSQMYNLIKNLVSKIEHVYTYSFEGKSFYKFVLEKEQGVYYRRIDREYFHAKSIFYQEYDFEVLNEKEELIKKLESYFENRNSLNRDDYYRFLINNKYFDVYKFDILEKIKKLCIDKCVLKDECDFLIYDSPHEEGFKFGILLSLELDEKIYEDVYKNVVSKLTYGDIFYEVYRKFKCLDEEYILSSHESYVFVIKWEMVRGNIKLDSLREIIFKYLDRFGTKLNSYAFVYIIVFLDHVDSTSIYNDVNMTTLKLKTIMKLLKEDNNKIIENDVLVYEIFNKCFEVYTKSFVSLTQFEVLEEIYNLFENKFVKLNGNEIEHKDIELNYEVDINKKSNFKMRYSEILKKINKIFKSSEADEYYENIFISQNIDLIISILSNETKFYNESMNLFYEYVNENSLNALCKIYKKSIENIFVARVFIKLLSFYPNVIISTLKDSKKLDLYVKILECSI